MTSGRSCLLTLLLIGQATDADMDSVMQFAVEVDGGLVAKLHNLGIEDLITISDPVGFISDWWHIANDSDLQGSA